MPSGVRACPLAVSCSFLWNPTCWPMDPWVSGSTQSLASPSSLLPGMVEPLDSGKRKPDQAAQPEEHMRWKPWGKGGRVILGSSRGRERSPRPLFPVPPAQPQRRERQGCRVCGAWLQGTHIYGTLDTRSGLPLPLMPRAWMPPSPASAHLKPLMDKSMPRLHTGHSPTLEGTRQHPLEHSDISKGLGLWLAGFTRLGVSGTP